MNTNIDLKKYERKNLIDKIVKGFFLILAVISSIFVIFIIIYILYKGIYPFIHDYGNNVKQSLSSFFTSSRWLYNGEGGMIFLLLTTLYTTFLSLLISVPVSVFSALFIVRSAPKFLKVILKTGIELLSSIPSVIYGLFGLGVICPLIAKMGVPTFGGNSIFSAVIVLALMSIPTITMLSISSIESVDNNLIKASLGLGASMAQTNMKIVLKSASSGIFAGIILGIGRALGEATAVQMVIGNGALGSNFLNIFNIGNTLTSAMLSGIGEATGLGYDVRFSLGLVLIIVILIVSTILNIIKNRINRIENKPSKLFKKEGVKNGK